jgi:hypothetical protein
MNHQRDAMLPAIAEKTIALKKRRRKAALGAGAER